MKIAGGCRKMGCHEAEQANRTDTEEAAGAHLSNEIGEPATCFADD